jgi:hypothetical protein
MPFRFYTNAVSQASKNAAAAVFCAGLLLMGFGVIIIALPELFAILAALVFFIAGIGCAATAVKIFLLHRKLDRLDDGQSQDTRVNVRIHRY